MLGMECETWERVRDSDTPGEKVDAVDEATPVRDAEVKEEKRKQEYAHLYKLYTSERARQTAAKDYEEENLGNAVRSSHILGPPYIDVPLLKSILAKNAHLPMGEIDIRRS